MVESWMLFVGVGALGGFVLGRWSAEARRARYDAKRLWDQRRNYRS